MRITGETVIDNPSGMLKPTDRGLVHALDLKQSKSGKISGTLSGVNQDGDLFEGKVKGSVCEADCSFKSTLIMMATGKKDCDITGSFALSNETTGRGNFTYQQFSGSYLGAGQEDFTLSKM